jgi:hypothetical protein
MTRKRHRGRPAPIPALETAALGEPAQAEASPEPPEQFSTAADPLLGEVQSFLSKRADLAKKLADEIEATENKLAELKRTAAMLFPENHGNGPKERKPKKVKLKAPTREATAAPQAAASDPTATDAAA